MGPVPEQIQQIHGDDVRETQAKKKSAGFCESSPVTIIWRPCQTDSGERELTDTKAECQETQIAVGALDRKSVV